MAFVVKNFIHLFKRFKMAFALNIVGLSVAFAVFIVVIIQVHYDFSYNKSFQKSENIYFLTSYHFMDKGRSPVTNIPNAKEIAAKFPEIKNYCILWLGGRQTFDLEKDSDNSATISLDLSQASPGFVDVFTPKILYGDAKEALRDTGKLLISQKTAVRVFGQENAVGKTIYNHYSQRAYTVAAVYEDFPRNSTIKNDCFTFLPDNDRSEVSFRLYVELTPNTANQIMKKLNSEEFLGEEQIKTFNEHPEYKFEYELTPLKELHLYLEQIRDGNINTTLSLLAVGILILVIAFINLLNISIAMIPSRVKTLNIHKILGINQGLLRTALATEALFFTLISFFLSLVYIQFFNESPLISFFSADIALSQNKALIAITALGFLSVAFLVNLYPAFYAAKLKMAIALKGTFSISFRGSKIRSSLVTVQLAVSIILIVVACFIKLQQNYMQHYDWGIQKENILFVPIRALKTDYKAFGDELKNNPNIVDYTASESIPGSVGMGWGRDFQGKKISIVSWPVTPNFLQFFGVEIIAGNSFSEENPSGREQIVLNQAFMRKYEFDNSIIGKEFECFNPGEVVGLVNDINFASLRYPIRPMGFVILNNKARLNHMFIKLSGGDIPGTLKYIEETWKKFSDEDFNPTFLDARLNDLYSTEKNLATLIGLFGIITVLISIMGIYGLISFNIRYKEKEIAIRKVNGSSVREIVLMLNRSLFIQLILAFAFAVPIAYYIVLQWLENFAYRTPVHWWVFPAAFAVVATIATATVIVQSLKAARTNPVEKLKTE